MFKSIIALSFIFYYGVVVSAQAKPTKVFDFGDNVVWSFDFIDSDNMVATLREGALFHVNLKSKKSTKLNAPKVHAQSQGGLLDIKVKKIKNDTFLYITYSKKLGNGKTTTALGRAKLNLKKKLIWKDIFVAKSQSGNSHHYGSRLLFVNDHIFMTIGDRGERSTAQDLSSHNGKVLRLNLDGSAAAGNPFAKTKNALPEIWSLGHRNPQGITYDENTKTIYTAEFGPLGGDEVNIVEKGKNYGWPVITYGKNYSGTTIGPTHKKGMEQPLVYWVPAISPSGIAFHQDKGDKFLYLASLGETHIRQVKIKSNKVVEQKKLIEDKSWRVRFTHVGPGNKLYFSTDSGGVFRL